MSPKEKRRSARRSATSKSSGSPSPDTASLPPTAHQHDANSSARSAASSSSNSTTARGKRAKEDSDDFQPPPPPSHRRTTSVASTANGAHSNSNNVASSSSSSNKRTKRKAKDNTQQPEEHQPSPLLEDELPFDGEEKQEEDAGITRCVCEGLAEDEADGADFMVQCEICLAWQHGPCMGFALEAEIPEGNYYCEQCRPQDHPDLIKKIQRRQRQSSEKSMHAAASRVSRSHSPTNMKTTKRRNTLNSREAAAYEESLEQLEASAFEAMPNGDAPAPKDRATSVASKQEEPVIEEAIEVGPTSNLKKKRKRADEEVSMAKRKRSASVISERVATISVATLVEKTEITSPITVNTTLLPPPTPVPSGKRAKRGGGGRKGAKDTPVSTAAPAPQDASINGDAEEGTASTKKHPNQYTYRGKAGGGQSRRAPQSSGSNNQNTSTHEHGTRRNNANNAANNASGGGAGSRQGHNAYYNNMQLPLFLSWGLPDYLSHLQSILPSDVPAPLELRGATSFLVPPSLIGVSPATPKETVINGTGNKPPSRGEAQETTEEVSNAIANTNDGTADEVDLAAMYPSATESVTERGVKVKWPAKRMSVSDMNKRVRALVEWVGREQALQAERERRKEALKTSVIDIIQQQQVVKESEHIDHVDNVMEATKATADIDHVLATMGFKPGPGTTPSTSKMMEELMEELISFQERFGPGAKQGKDRRVAVLA